MFEHHSHPLISIQRLIWRMVYSTLAGICLIAISLFIGMWGYHYYENLSWVDSFVNAAMILSGMGPFEPLKTSSGKIFAGFYALYSGLALITIAAIIFAPIIHRFLHKFHLEQK
ncbi:MAG: hypothetical protein NT145_07025 [Elusimicrobia bacterium]|nr:hypothetical protein [Elusimicrobiota bacterium]